MECTIALMEKNNMILFFGGFSHSRNISDLNYSIYMGIDARGYNKSMWNGPVHRWRENIRMSFGFAVIKISSNLQNI